MPSRRRADRPRKRRRRGSTARTGAEKKRDAGRTNLDEPLLPLLHLGLARLLDLGEGVLDALARSRLHRARLRLGRPDVDEDALHGVVGVLARALDELLRQRRQELFVLRALVDD